MRPRHLILIPLAALAGCSVETIEVERQPRSAFEGNAAALDAYNKAFDECSSAEKASDIAREHGPYSSRDTRHLGADDAADAYARGEDDTEIGSAKYSGCLDGFEKAGFD